ncbi:hypothetical protein ILYODFUR_017205, partial [Ilyodon furcidens]
DLREVWLHYPPHPLQVQEPQTDRQLIETSPVLQKLTSFEDSIGVLFTHVRLLARAFTLRTVGFNHLTLCVHLMLVGCSQSGREFVFSDCLAYPKLCLFYNRF